MPLSPVMSTITVLVGHAADGLVHFAHRRATADDRVADVVVRNRFADDGRHAHQPAQFERLADDAGELVQVDRLEQVVEGPLA